jgi:hypothetical protein
VKYKKDFKKMQNVVLGGAMIGQGARLLSDTSPSGLMGTTQGFAGLTVAGATANMAMDMALGGFKKRKRR